MIILDNIGRSEYASSRAVQVSDKCFSCDDMIDRLVAGFILTCSSTQNVQF